jgi:hypothetical protein
MNNLQLMQICSRRQRQATVATWFGFSEEQQYDPTPVPEDVVLATLARFKDYYSINPDGSLDAGADPEDEDAVSVLAVYQRYGEYVTLTTMDRTGFMAHWLAPYWCNAEFDTPWVSEAYLRRIAPMQNRYRKALAAMRDALDPAVPFDRPEILKLWTEAIAACAGVGNDHIAGYQFPPAPDFRNCSVEERAWAESFRKLLTDYILAVERMAL